MKASKIDFKTFGFVEDLRVKSSFRKRVKEIRKDNHIPPTGFDITVYDELIIKEKYPRIPAKINKNVFLADVKNLLSHYGLSSDWLDYFSDRILFGFFGTYTELRQIITLDFGTKTKSSEINKRVINDANNFDLNPIVMFLPPFFTQRELIDYIEVNFEEIEKMQNKYFGKDIKNNTKGSRQERFKDIIRNRYIYKHRNLSKKELASKVNKNFKQNLDHAYLNKIIREWTRINKKRNKVQAHK